MQALARQLSGTGWRRFVEALTLVWVEPLLQPRRSAADTGQRDIPRDRRSSARAEWANRTRRTANQHYYRVTCEQAKSSEPCDAIALIHQLQSE